MLLSGVRKTTLTITMIGFVILCVLPMSGWNASFQDLLKPVPKAAGKVPAKAPAKNNLEEQFRQALKLMQSGKHDQALGIFKKLDKQAPNNPAVLLNMGIIYRAKNSPKAAKPYFVKVLKTDPDNVPSLFHLSAISLQLKENPQALSYAQRLARLQPKDFQSQNLLGVAYIENSNPTKALEAFKKAYNLNPKDMGNLMNLVRVSAAKEDFAGVLTYGSKVLAQNPKDGRLNMMVGFAAEKLQKTSTAIKYYEAASKLPGVEIDALMSLGRLYAATGQSEKSFNRIRQVIRLDKSNYEANMRVGHDLYGRSNLKQAEPFFITAQKSNPESAEPSLFIALIRARTNRLDEAFAAAQTAIKNSPKNKSVMEVYGYIQENRKVYNDAIDNYRNWLKYYPEDTFVYPKIANILLLQGKPDLAAEEYELALKKHPKDFNLNLAYAELLMSQRDEAGAYKQYQAALALKPNNPEAAVGSAICLQKQSKVDEAVELLEKLLVTSPDSEKARLTLAGLYRDQKKEEQAVEQYEKVLRSSPQNMQALISLVAMYESQKNYEDAIATYRELIKVDPKNIAFPVSIVNMYDAWGKRDLAIEEARKLVKSDPKNTNFRATLAALLMKSEDWENALAEYAELEKTDMLSEKAYAYQKCGEIRERQEKPEDAIVCYKNALQAVPDYNQALTGLERLYKATGKQAELQSYITELISEAKENSPYSFYYHLMHAAQKGPEAIKTLNELSSKYPKYASIHSTLAVAYTDEGEKDKAIEHYMLILEIKPDDAATNKKLGLMLQEQGKDQDALKYLEKAASVNTFDKKLILTLAQTYEKLGDKLRARNKYKDYLIMDPANQEVKNKIRELEPVKPIPADKR